MNRMKAIVPLGYNLLASILFVLGRENILVILLRPASKAERKQYDQSRRKA
jgi:uncharacterized DUF497 family protein